MIAPCKFIPDAAERDAWHAEQARRRDEGDPDARNRLVEANLPLAKMLAAISARRNTDRFREFYSEGCKALIRAAEKFDPARGVKFSTYAGYWIRQAITRYRVECIGLIRVPAYLGSKKKGNRPEFMAMGRRARGVQAAGWSGSKEPDPVLGVACHRGGGVPLDSQVAATLADAVAALPDRERRVIALRFGFEDGTKWTLSGTGKQVGVCKERVRQIERDALALLRMELTDRGVGPDSTGGQP